MATLAHFMAMKCASVAIMRAIMASAEDFVAMKRATMATKLLIMATTEDFMAMKRAIMAMICRALATFGAPTARLLAVCSAPRSICAICAADSGMTLRAIVPA